MDHPINIDSETANRALSALKDESKGVVIVPVSGGRIHLASSQIIAVEEYNEGAEFSWGSVSR